MKIKSIKSEVNYDGIVLTVTLPKSENQAVEKILPLDDKLASEYELSIEKRKQTRSMTANSYLWVLLGKMAAVLKTTKEEVYRHYIVNTSAFVVSYIPASQMECWKKCWEIKGTGWISEPLSVDSQGDVEMINYYGSSVYTTKEMAHLIDLVVSDCKDLGIETMPPEEINRLISVWS